MVAVMVAVIRRAVIAMSCWRLRSETDRIGCSRGKRFDVPFA